MTDGPALWRLARASGTLDVNPPYAYLMACRNFADTSLVAQAGGWLAGYVLAYRPGPDPQTLFVWQVTVHPSARGHGLAHLLLDAALGTQGASGVRYLEATITPSNEPSWRLFRSLARSRSANFHEEPCFPAELFPDGAHDEERLIRIGPLSARN